MIEDLDDKNKLYLFPCGQWLTDGDAGQLYRELYPVTKRMAMRAARTEGNLILSHPLELAQNYV